MREIKFRAWNGKRMICEDDFFVRDGKAWEFMEFDPPQKTDYPLMQYTGLLDVNGVEIYEGDILKTEIDFGYGLQPVIAKVIWKEAGWQFDSPAGCAYGGSGCFSVIGNIYENPELLEAQS